MRRRTAAPAKTKPLSSIAQLEVSGTADTAELGSSEELQSSRTGKVRNGSFADSQHGSVALKCTTIEMTLQVVMITDFALER